MHRPKYILEIKCKFNKYLILLQGFVEKMYKGENSSILYVTNST
jgi:hypothetical protein